MKLKGVFGAIERISIIFFLGFSLPFVLAKFPKELPLLENQYFIICLFLSVLGGLGIIFSLIVRFRAWKNLEFRTRHTNIE